MFIAVGAFLPTENDGHLLQNCLPFCFEYFRCELPLGVLRMYVIEECHLHMFILTYSFRMAVPATRVPPARRYTSKFIRHSFSN
jgi:hypothetical protein